MLFWLIACQDPTDSSGSDSSTSLPGDDTDTVTVTTETDTLTGTETGSTTDDTTTGDTGTTITEPVCATDNTISSVTTTTGPITTMLEVEVEVAQPSAVAVQCTSDDELDQVFFAESTDLVTSHTLRLSGLIARTDYTCTAAAICPATSTPETFTYTTGAAPADVKRLDAVIDPKLGMTGAWTLAPLTTNIFSNVTYLVAWGPDGRPRWWTLLPSGVGMWVEARYDIGEGTVVWGGGMDNEGRVRILDLWEGETYAFAPVGWTSEEFHHDGKRIADGRLMTMEIRENSLGASSWDGFGIRVVDPVTDVVELDFNSQVLVDDGTLAPGGGFIQDPWHANWMEYVEESGGPKLYVSLCLAFQIVKIDATTGKADWLLGTGKGWTVLDAAGGVLSETKLPQCQHGLEVSGDNLLVYDNGQTRNVSYAQEWHIDGATKTATLLWEWTEPGFSEDYLGDIDYLANDRVLVTQATMFGEGAIVEVDRATGDVASRFTLGNGGYTYRAERYDGCDMFSSARECPDLQARLDELAPLLLLP